MKVTLILDKKKEEDIEEGEKVQEVDPLKDAKMEGKEEKHETSEE